MGTDRQLELRVPLRFEADRWQLKWQEAEGSWPSVLFKQIYKMLAQAFDSTERNDDVIEHAHAKQSPNFNQLLRRLQVFITGRQLTCGMVVRNNDRVCIREQRGFEDFTRMHKTCGNCSMAYLVIPDYMVLCVQVEGDEILL